MRVKDELRNIYIYIYVYIIIFTLVSLYYITLSGNRYDPKPNLVFDLSNIGFCSPTDRPSSPFSPSQAKAKQQHLPNMQA